MRFKVNQSTVELIQGDIVGQDVDAIVNAANAALLGRRRCGRRDPPCGRARAAGRVPHAGPLPDRRGAHHQGLPAQGAPCHPCGRASLSAAAQQDAELLASAYRNSLELASQHGLKTIAFPAISTGIYGYPLDQAAPIALRTVKQYLEQHPEIELVRFVLWDATALKAYERAARGAICGSRSAVAM